MLGYNDCDANFAGLLKKKCSRCTKVRHTCDPFPTSREVVGLANTVFAARDALALARRDEDDDAEALAAFTAANVAFKSGLSAAHRNKNKMTGDAPTPRKRSGGSSVGDSVLVAEVVKELQETNRSLRGLMEVGREVSQKSFQDLPDSR